MSFITWHYSEGIEYYVKGYKYTVQSVVHYFSLPLLLRTLFSPWRRLSAKDTGPGFNIERYFNTFMFNFISRLVGAMARLTMFVVGNLTVLLAAILGMVGLFFWLIFPPLSYGVYRRSEGTAEAFIEKLIAHKGPIIGNFLATHNGKFFTDRLGVDARELLDALITEPQVANANSIQEIIQQSIDQKCWNEGELRNLELMPSDLVTAAHWMDKHARQFTELQMKSYGVQGIGMSMLYGYTPKLDKYSNDLLKNSNARRLVGREGIVSQIERTLTSGSSVILVGQPGVGKKTVVREFAVRASHGEFGQEMSYRRVLELDYNFLFSEATDLSQKKTILSQVLNEAASAGNVLLVIRDIHRLIDQSAEGIDFTDVIEPHLESRDLKIIAISTSLNFEQYVRHNMRISKFLQQINVTQPSTAEALHILVMYAQELESTNKVLILVPALRTIIQSTDDYVTETPFPEKALEILDAVVSYANQSGKRKITVNHVQLVLSERTGIDFTKMTTDHKKKLANIEDIIHEKLVNQETAVKLIGQVLRSKTLGVVKTDRPVGSLLFLGPTGVGKTQTAKVLADVYYGSENQILRFDMAEYAGGEGVERLIGSATKNIPGSLTSAIRAKPASLLLLDEIEKAPAEVFNLMLSLLDEGVITDAFNRKVSAKNMFVIATSNAAAEQTRQLVANGITGDDLQKRVVEQVLSDGHFSPELLNRFDGVVVYEPLSSEHLVQIAALQFTELAQNLKEKNILMEADRATIEKLAREGYRPEFGARPMRRIIELYIGDMLGKALLSGELTSGDTITIIPTAEANGYTWQKQS